MPLHRGRSDLAPAGRGAAAPIAHSQIDMLKQVQRTAEQMSTMHFPKMECAMYYMSTEVLTQVTA